MSVQGVLHTEEKGDRGWMSSPKSVFRDWQRSAERSGWCGRRGSALGKQTKLSGNEQRIFQLS